MKVIITMAGLGSRFRKAGYQIPKYQIEVRGHSLFYWSMTSLSGLNARDYIFIVRAEDHAAEFIRRECAALKIRPAIVQLDHMTAGQAETAMQAAPYWDPDDAIMIYNIDTYVEPGWIKESDIKGDGFIPCFHGEGDHWSFVKLNDAGLAVEVREKKRISDHCTVGAYYFKTAKLFETLYYDYYDGKTDLDAGELYIAPLYNHLVGQKGQVYICDIPADAVHVLGTPEEVEAFANAKS